MFERPAQKAPGSMRSPDVDAVSEQRQGFVGLPHRQAEEPGQGAVDQGVAEEKRRYFKLPSLRSAPALGKAAREERATQRGRQRELAAIEAAKQAFFETPAGRARLAYKRGQHLFQYELEINDLPPLVIPGTVGTPSRETTDPVDVLNSVTVEGWKLITGKFIHSEVRGGAIGCYLFKRSQKRRLPMNNPWQV
jgi:hypothetical protein